MTTRTGSGIIAGIDHHRWNLNVLSADGERYSVAQKRISNAPGGHRCLARENDEITFMVDAGDRITEVRFAHPLDAEIADEEVSIVITISNDLIFGERIDPNCRCPILIAQEHKFPEIEIGMIVTHNLGRYNNRPMATNIRVDWTNPYGELNERP
jgi:hypothetical protein